MHIRDWLRAHPSAATGIAAGALVVAVVLMLLQIRGSGAPEPEVQDQIYYSADDGASFFPAQRQQSPIKTEDGRTAVKAHVYKCLECEGTPLFINHLERHAAQGAATQPSADEPAGPTVPYQNYKEATQMVRAYSAIQVKKPQQRQWVPAGTANATAIMTGRCPVNANHPVQPVLP